jgi:hypothetical protein
MTSDSNVIGPPRGYSRGQATGDSDADERWSPIGGGTGGIRARRMDGGSPGAMRPSNFRSGSSEGWSTAKSSRPPTLKHRQHGRAPGSLAQRAAMSAASGSQRETCGVVAPEPQQPAAAGISPQTRLSQSRASRGLHLEDDNAGRSPGSAGPRWARSPADRPGRRPGQGLSGSATFPRPLPVKAALEPRPRPEVPTIRR